MSFYGKKFTKSIYDKIEDFLDSFNIDEQIKTLLTTRTSTCFTETEEGIKHVVETESGTVLYDKDFKFGEETEFSVHGKTGTQISTLEDNTMTTVMKIDGLPEVTITRVFEDESLIMTIAVDGTDKQATISYVLAE